MYLPYRIFYHRPQQQTEAMFARYNAAEAIDTLHKCVLDAKEAQKNGVEPVDAWRSDLPPRTAVRARTVPVLMEERDRMKAELEEVFSRTMLKIRC